MAAEAYLFVGSRTGVEIYYVFKGDELTVQLEHADFVALCNVMGSIGLNIYRSDLHFDNYIYVGRHSSKPNMFAAITGKVKFTSTDKLAITNGTTPVRVEEA